MAKTLDIINIQEIYREYIQNKLPKLQQLIWTIPENEKYYNIRLDMPLNLIFKSEDKPPLKQSALIVSNNVPGIEDMDLLPSPYVPCSILDYFDDDLIIIVP